MRSKILSIFEIKKIVIFTILTTTLITCWSTNAHSDEGLIIKVQTVEKQLSNVLERLDQLEKNISFMAEQKEYSGKGQNVKLTYSKKTIDTHGAWNGKDTYTVPRDGTLLSNDQLQKR